MENIQDIFEAWFKRTHMPEGQATTSLLDLVLRRNGDGGYQTRNIQAQFVAFRGGLECMRVERAELEAMRGEFQHVGEVHHYSALRGCYLYAAASWTREVPLHGDLLYVRKVTSFPNDGQERDWSAEEAAAEAKNAEA